MKGTGRQVDMDTRPDASSDWDADTGTDTRHRTRGTDTRVGINTEMGRVRRDLLGWQVRLRGSIRALLLGGAGRGPGLNTGATPLRLRKGGACRRAGQEARG